MAHPRAVKIFVGYAQQDAAFHERFAKHLAPLRQGGLLELSDAQSIPVGTDFRDATQARIADAAVIVLLVSPDLVGDDAVWQEQVVPALKRQTTGDARVVPVLIRAVVLADAELGRLPLLPKD